MSNVLMVVTYAAWTILSSSRVVLAHISYTKLLFHMHILEFVCWCLVLCPCQNIGGNLKFDIPCVICATRVVILTELASVLLLVGKTNSRSSFGLLG